MNKEFVNYNQALKLKELGFDEPCFGFYQLEYGEIRPIMVDDNEQYRLTGYRTCKNSEIPKHYTSAPTYQQAFRWFREKYGMIFTLIASTYYYPSVSFINTDGNSEIELGEFETYEEAELACLDKLIEIVESKSE
jgi:hypothetical protein